MSGADLNDPYFALSPSAIDSKTNLSSQGQQQVLGRPSTILYPAGTNIFQLKRASDSLSNAEEMSNSPLKDNQLARTILEDIEYKMNSQITDVQLMLSHQDLNHQRQSQQTKRLANEISELKEMFQGGGLVPIIERMVAEVINKDREKEPEARMGKNNKNNPNGLLKEFVVLSDEIKILQTQLKELHRSMRVAQDDISDSRQRIFMLGTLVDEKAQKVYVDYHIGTCVQKDSIKIINEALMNCATKQDLENMDKLVDDHVKTLQEQISGIRNASCLKEDIWVILNENLQKQSGSFLPREEFSYYKESATEKTQEMAETLENQVKLSRVFDKEMRDVKQALLHKSTKDDIIKINTELLKFCAYSDLKDLYIKVVPSIARFEDKLIDFYKEIEQCQLMLQRMDEIMSSKVNKQSFDDLGQFAKTLAPISMVLQKERDSIERFHLGQRDHLRIKDDLAIISVNIQREIMASVRKQTANIRNQLVYHKDRTALNGVTTHRNTPEYEDTDHEQQAPQSPKSTGGKFLSINSHDLKMLIDAKIDRVDLECQMDQKANKQDASRALMGMEILHSQLSHIIVLIVEFAKHVGLGPQSEEKLETEKARSQRKAFLYKQAQKICRWVFSFDPEQVSSVTNSSGDNMQERLIQQTRELKKGRGYQDPWGVLRQNELETEGVQEQGNPARHTAHRQRKREANQSNVNNPICHANQSFEAPPQTSDASTTNPSLQQVLSDQHTPRVLTAALAAGAIRGGIPQSIKNRLLIMDKNKLLQTQQQRSMVSSVQSSRLHYNLLQTTPRVQQEQPFQLCPQNFSLEDQSVSGSQELASIRSPFMQQRTQRGAQHMLLTTLDLKNSLAQNSLGGSTTLGGQQSIGESPILVTGDDQAKKQPLNQRQLTLLNKSVEVLKDYQSASINFAKPVSRGENSGLIGENTFRAMLKPTLHHANTMNNSPETALSPRIIGGPGSSRE